ncbi:DUF4129 domain-containing transglutaminase family protein [Corticicoccus populi]|uniref:DUF4129 domain-containing transglutaminase family protein n=1 Tax=Corticicoccus populi TaxID=1812821 RepID=A0ABW5WW02_9STAP
MKQSGDNGWRPLLLYSAGFFLFLEWIYPLQTIFEDTRIDLFILFTVICFLITYLRLNRIIRFLINGSVLLIIIHILYFDSSILDVRWLGVMVQEILLNISLIFSGQWFQLTLFFRTILCLLLIWSMAMLLYRLMAVRKDVLFFIILTFLMIAAVDSYTSFDGTYAVIRVFIISMITLGLSGMSKVIKSSNVRVTHIQKMIYWAVPLLLCIPVITYAAYQAPKHSPEWTNPVPFLENLSIVQNEGEGQDNISRIGYSADDSVLGGSLVLDNTLLFEAEVTEDHYWRLETKDIYTGRGWEVSNQENPVEQADGSVTLTTFNSDNVQTESMNTGIDYRGGNGLPLIAYPYGVVSIDAENNNGVLNLYENSETLVFHYENAEDGELGYQEISYEHPVFDTENLRNSPEDDNQDILEQYTQLPDNLPERVFDLSSEITEPFDNRFDKARAVENYFNANGFDYQLTDVPTTGEGEDYVDQFLFETQYGYCDNFSTAMVVMLRTQDIPARWVKGFTSGERRSQDTDETDTYINRVTNSNAHSWVEVYFPETGWVPFEPTQGFTNLADFEEVESETAVEPQESETEEPVIDEPETPETEIEENNEEAADSENSGSRSPTLFLTAGISSLIILLLLFVLIKWRRIRIYFIRKRLVSSLNSSSFKTAYFYLLKLLGKTVGERTEDETLREYAERVDQAFLINEMSRLTKIYEEMLYSKRNVEYSDEIIDLWETLIDKINKHKN